MSDVLSILNHNSLLLTKTWQSNGTIKPYGNALNYTLQKIAVNNIHELSALLTKLERKPKSCLIRGAYTGTETKKILRRKDFFKDQALHTLCIDIDKYTPVSANPVLDPVASIDEFIAEHLPEAFAAASYHWQLSTSAGHPSKQGVLKAHVWFWLSAAANCASLHTWATGMGIDCDKALFDEIQIHYTSSPVFEIGVSDPVPVRSGFCAGVAGDEVEIDIPYIEPQQGKVRNRSIDAAAGEDDEDEVSAALKEMNCYKGRNRDGSVAIVCPFSAQHSDGIKDSMTTTVYWLSGTGDFEQGHFDCRHDGCRARSDEEFKVALGLEEEGGGFEALPPLEQSETGVALPLESIFGKILKQNEDGRTLAVIENVALILNSPKNCGRDIRYDTFRDEIVYKLIGGDNWNPFTDTDYTELRISLANTGFLPISHEMMRQAVHLVAKKRIFDTAIEWINTLKWDGIERVKHFNEIYMGAELDEYNSAVSEYMWAALAGRILSPGCKADAAPIFVGEQFVGKTYAVMNMVPDLRYYCEINFEDKDDDLARKMRGKLVAEFAEMRGFQGRDSESTKAFISRQYEEWTPKYMEFVTIYPRRLLFIGTSNRDELFTDETGNRREFPVRVSKANIELIKKDRSQLWAEGKEMFLKKGVEYYYRIANDLAKDIRAEFMITDAWDDKIYDYLYAKDVDGLRPVDREYFLVSDIMHDCLGFESKNMKTYDAQRIGKILRKHDCEKFVKRQNGYRLKVWRKKPG